MTTSPSSTVGRRKGGKNRAPARYDTLAVRITNDVGARVDAHIDGIVFRNRSDVVREAVRRFLNEARPLQRPGTIVTVFGDGAESPEVEI